MPIGLFKTFYNLLKSLSFCVINVVCCVGSGEIQTEIEKVGKRKHSFYVSL